MEKDTKYNGWTNYETWLVNLWTGEYLYDIIREYEAEEREDLDALADFCQEVVHDLLADSGHLPESGLAADIVLSFLRAANWREIAEHANED